MRQLETGRERAVRGALWIVSGACAFALGCGGGSRATKPTTDSPPPANAPVVADEGENHVDEPLTDATSPCPPDSPHCGDTTTTVPAPTAAAAPAPDVTLAPPPAQAKGAKLPTSPKPQAAAVPAASPAQIAHGAQIYNKYCDTCHPGGNADPDYGPKIRDLAWTVPRITALIRTGKGRMKPIPTKKISDTDLPDLLAYLVTLRAVAGVPR